MFQLFWQQSPLAVIALAFVAGVGVQSWRPGLGTLAFSTIVLAAFGTGIAIRQSRRAIGVQLSPVTGHGSSVTRQRSSVIGHRSFVIYLTVLVTFTLGQFLTLLHLNALARSGEELVSIGQRPWRGTVESIQPFGFKLTRAQVRLSQNHLAQVELSGKAQLNTGDQVVIRCQDWQQFLYANREDRYPLLHGQTASCQGATTIERHEASGMRQGTLERWRLGLSNALQKSLDSTDAALLAGILWGERTSLPKSLKDAFRMVGLSHLVAVSGANLVIFVTALLAVGPWLGLRRQRMLILAFALVWLFSVFTGSSSSVVRAALMVSLALVAQLLGRKGSVGTSLLISLAVMVALNPLALSSDIGLQLSFLSTAGLVYWSDWFSERLGFLERWPSVHESLSCTLAALLTTVPISLFQFSQLSLIAPLANVLAAPLIPLIMLWGSLHLGLALVLPKLTWVTAAFVDKPLHLLEQVAMRLAALPGAALQDVPVSLAFITLGYAALGWWLLQRLRPVRSFLKSEK